MIWKSLSVLSASSSPIVVVLSGSMEPAFQRGDLLFLWNRAPRAEIGEIVVYNVVGYICLDCGLFGANVCLFFFFLLAERKRHSHCAPRITNISRGGRKEQ
jgi:signal peptidase I